MTAIRVAGFTVFQDALYQPFTPFVHNLVHTWLHIARACLSSVLLSSSCYVQKCRLNCIKVGLLGWFHSLRGCCKSELAWNHPYPLTPLCLPPHPPHHLGGAAWNHPYPLTPLSLFPSSPPHLLGGAAWNHPYPLIAVHPLPLPQLPSPLPGLHWKKWVSRNYKTIIKYRSLLYHHQ